MKMLVASLLVCVLASSASALVDDGHGSLGCYFDDQGDVNCFNPTPGIPFNLYFVLARPIYSGLGGFEFAWRFEPTMDPAPVLLHLELPPNALNIGDWQNLLVGLGTGLVSTEATLLATCFVIALGPVPAGQGIAVGPPTPASIPGHAAYCPWENIAVISPMTYSTCPGNGIGWCTVATLDCDAQVVAAESATWGAVKALYR